MESSNFQLSVVDTVDRHSQDHENECGGQLTFNPPVYIQRYCAIRDVLNEERWQCRISKVADFGCADFKFFKYIKPITNIKYICGIDIDRELMNKCCYNARPLLFEYTSSFSRDLIVDLFVGSIAETDERLLDIDAVICIELIEHLYADVLEKVPSTVFEFIKPELAIFTTPNADFNVLFDLEKFRHDDHKFEWTRKEFEDWCFKITEKYSLYDVNFCGIGAGPKGTENLGCCSQMAIFSKKAEALGQIETSLMSVCQGKIQPYELYSRIIYPSNKDDRSEDKKFMDEVSYRISSITYSKLAAKFQREDSSKYEIPITYLWEFLKSWCPTVEILTERLKNKGYVVDKNSSVLIHEEESSSESDEYYEEEMNTAEVSDGSEENWN